MRHVRFLALVVGAVTLPVTGWSSVPGNAQPSHTRNASVFLRTAMPFTSVGKEVELITAAVQLDVLAPALVVLAASLEATTEPDAQEEGLLPPPWRR